MAKRPPEKMTKVQLRAAAYRLVASGMLGHWTPATDAERGASDVALRIVYGDERKNLSAGERNIRQWVRTLIAFSVITDPELLTTMGDAVTGSLLDSSS